MMTRFFRLGITLVILAGVLAGCTDEAIGRYRNLSVSMQPTLYEDEYLFTDNLAYIKQSPQRGDIILFNRAGGPTLIKRVIGLPDETIEIRDGSVFINGAKLIEPYANQPMIYSLPTQTIEPSHYFVLGDNRNNSSDSHVWGTIDISDIIGRATLVYYPFEQVRFIARPKYTAH